MKAVKILGEENKLSGSLLVEIFNMKSWSGESIPFKGSKILMQSLEVEKDLLTLKEILKIQDGFRIHFHVQIVTFKSRQWPESYGPCKWFWKAIKEYFFF